MLHARVKDRLQLRIWFVQGLKLLPCVSSPGIGWRWLTDRKIYLERIENRIGQGESLLRF